MSDPLNVPEPTSVQWRRATREPATYTQIEWLGTLAAYEGIDLAQLYGEGYRSMGNLSKWAAHWGIEVLESRQAVRAYEKDEAEHADYLERSTKNFIARHYLKRNPNLRRSDV